MKETDKQPGPTPEEVSNQTMDNEGGRILVVPPPDVPVEPKPAPTTKK